jgi:hypothetical protein
METHANVERSARARDRIRIELDSLTWQERVNAVLEEMVFAMRILAQHQPAGTNGVTAGCLGNGDRIEVTYIVAAKPDGESEE